ncbi:MAG TPA: type II secretion system protein [Nitrospira sp.]|nr:type II secretion system protein [Nitrospira sp.]
MPVHFRNERGVTYLFLMFAIVLIGLSTTAAAKQWKVMVQRELEADLLSKGIEIQNALALYSASKKAGRVMPGEVYPQSLVELTRLPKPYLRKAYADPMSHGDWEYLRSPTGGIMGVRSKSRGKPLKKHDFPQTVRHLEGRASYYDWIFQHPNPSTAGSLPVGPALNPLLPTAPNPALQMPPTVPSPAPQLPPPVIPPA